MLLGAPGCPCRGDLQPPRTLTRATCPGHVWRMVPQLSLLRPSLDSVSSSSSVVHLTEYVFHNAVHRSRPASSLMPKLFRYLRASYALIGHDLPNGKFATVVIIIFLQAIRHVHRHDDAKTKRFFIKIGKRKTRHRGHYHFFTSDSTRPLPWWCNYSFLLSSSVALVYFLGGVTIFPGGTPGLC